MAENNNLDKKIKETFDALNKAAPENLWSSLSHKLPLPDSDKNIEAKIKTVFENLDKAAPPQIWSSVNKQLNIDKVWERINAELDIRAVIFRRNIAGLVASLLVGLLGGIYIYNQNAPEFKLNGTQVVIQQLHENNFASRHNKSGNNNVDIKPVPSPANLQSSSNKSKEINSSNILSKGKPSFNVFVRKSDEPNKAEINRNPVTAVYQQNNVAINTSSANILNASDSLCSAIILNYKLININNNQNDGELILNSQSPLINIASDTLWKKNVPVPKFKRLEIGLTYSYNKTWLLNYETRKSFDQNSLIQTSAAFASSYGLVANYNFSKQSALSFDFYYNSKIAQQYNLFTEGVYTNRNIEFNYTKLVLSYQLNINQPSYRKIPSRYMIKAGFYGAYLKNYKDVYNKTVEPENNKYSSTDCGLKLAIGQEKTFGSIIFSYGANAEYGLKNSFAGNSQMTADFNVTKNALFGMYLNLKYAFSKTNFKFSDSVHR